MKQYHDMLEYIFDNGEQREDRTGTGTISVFGYQNRYNLQEGFPAITTKKLFWKGVVAELLWFLRGDTNIKYLQDNGVHIWDDWADEKGELGPVYGKQWRYTYHWDTTFGDIDGTIDQIANVIQSIRENPESRRHVVSAWNVGELEEMALVPCHAFFQFYVRKGKYLDCHLYQRSADAFLGVPFNIASYSLLTHIIAQICDLEPGEFIHTFGDLHIYKNHIEQVKLQLTRDEYPLPSVQIPEKISLNDLDKLKIEDFKLINYKSHPAIKAPIAV